MSKKLIFPPDWHEFSNLILQRSSGLDNETCSILLIGPKNSGKTTFSLKIAGEILSNNKNIRNHIYVLDCDIGQPLISPSRCIKLVKWKIADISIENSNNINIFPEVMFYIGGNSPIVYPLRYLIGLKQCFEYLKTLEENITLILNIPGWITGVGLEISSVITAFCIDISSSVYIGFTKEFEQITAGSNFKNFNRDGFLLFPSFDINLVRNAKNLEILIDNRLKTRLFVNTLSDLFSILQISEQKRNTNPLNFFDEYIGYHSIGRSIFKHFCKTVHFPFSSICIIPCPGTTLLCEQLKYQMPYRLTNSVVALCIFKDDDHQFIPDFSIDGHKLNILDTDIIFPCIGFGIVHHINYQSNSVVLTTPYWIPTDTLSEVNALQLTEIMLPQNVSGTSKPYVCKKKLVVKGISSGGKVPSNRKNVKRKIHNA
ncbi:GTPase Grc3p-like Pre-mRNA cleavage complex [Cryptosporidium canis]|uniref:GTPase Grc3p-like Pre-mRNA cleavage complex n=1 Tax=Cryptosporidium canis TaxID=195482 RepID=A0ABQ8P2F1_9CRYT|nr:GTPase Grc3p-like Pre-mRNA cleavage complex [Cryptosporidium canis]KAJ1614805.1 GTPase Grc3p-like Pre-mRNA cleavage complex [Cryptosporidium canis]